MNTLRLALLLAMVSLQAAAPASQKDIRVTHGPMLGRPGTTHMAVWARTSRPGAFRVRYGLDPARLTQFSEAVTTALDRDNTGAVMLRSLESNTKYFYQVVPEGGEGAPAQPDGSFRTLPDPDAFRNAEHNPRGLFNFRFEFGTGNNQNPSGSGPWPPVFKTALAAVQDKVHFAIQNGDFIYEEHRDYTVQEWREQVGLTTEPTPPTVQLAPTIVGVWENYKVYMARGEALAAWHRNIPGFFTFDDHEIIDNVEGTGTTGFRDRKAVFRDIGVQGWYDYLGWANPVPPGRIHFGKAQLKAGSDVLADPDADFVRTAASRTAPGDLHVHWGGPLAGVRQRDYALVPDAKGDPNAGVYQISEILDAHRLRISPPAPHHGEASYSIGRTSYFDQRVGNAHFFFLDTRGHRDVGDVQRPERRDLSMLGAKQKAWLMEGMKTTDADVLFVVSQVMLMIPHVGGTASPEGFSGQPTPVVHDEAWPVFLAEREELINFWDSLGKSVLVLSGDTHNSFSIKVTDRVWELASGPHNSRNHRADSEGFRPANGIYDSRGRSADIRWSSYFHPDTPGSLIRQPIYTVVQMNNVFNNPLEPGRERWMAYPHAQVVVQFFDGLTGDLLYAESIRVAGGKPRQR